jgi:hypothetical protein
MRQQAFLPIFIQNSAKCNEDFLMTFVLHIRHGPEEKKMIKFLV